MDGIVSTVLSGVVVSEVDSGPYGFYNMRSMVQNVPMAILQFHM